MKKNIFAFLICICFFSCSERCYHRDLGYALILDHVKKMQEMRTCFLGALGGSFYDDHVNKLDVNISHIQEVDVETARDMIVDGIEKFLKSINDDQKIHDYLLHYPFTYTDIIYSMDFLSESGTFVPEPGIAYVSLVKGKIYYCVNDQKTKKLEDIAQEPYLEALEKVKRKNEENLLSIADPS